MLKMLLNIFFYDSIILYKKSIGSYIINGEIYGNL